MLKNSNKNKKPNELINLIGIHFKKVTSWIFSINFWKFYTLILFLSIVQNGIWYSPQTERLLLISKDIFTNPFINSPENQWLLSSYLGPFLGYITKMNSSLITYSLMHLAIFILFFTILLRYIYINYGDFIARSVLIIFFTSPISNVLFTWLGSPDILTILLSMIIVLRWENPVLLFITSLLLGVNHPEQGLIILLFSSSSFFYIHKKEPLKFTLVEFSGFLLGKLLLKIHFDLNNFATEFNRLDYISNAGISTYVKATFSNPFALIFSLFNILIIFVIAYILYFWKKDKTSKVFVAYTIFSFFVMLITLDQTRVFSILIFPALLLIVLSDSYRNMNYEETKFFKNILSLCFLLGLVIPRFVVWGGDIYFSSYQEWLNYLL